MKMYYFAYGSNMSKRRLSTRVPSAKKVDTGKVEQHQLKFHKIGSNDGTAKCDIHATGNPGHSVHGVLFHVSAEEKPELDRIEGVGYGYEIKTVSVRLNNNSVIEAFTYYATHINENLEPLCWYKEHVLRGAQENALPKEYIHMIESIKYIEDTDLERRESELSIYR